MDGSVPLCSQGSRFEISAVGSLCLPQLVYYTASTCHSKHILTHLRDSHRLHINTRAAVCCIQQLEDMQGQKSEEKKIIISLQSIHNFINVGILRSLQ